MPVTDEQLNGKSRKSRAKAVTGDRVQAANALAVANQSVVGEMQTVLRAAVEAQIQSGQQAAKIAHAVETGELAWGAFQQELATLRQDRVQLTPTFSTLDVAKIMPSPEEAAQIMADAIDWQRLDAIRDEYCLPSKPSDEL